MYLKRIELSGFKTFPDLTEVVLSPGVTGVVGPNGCGKSNLMDAVRWVLGEQRARILRGGKMEDVIFSGTPQRPGMSAAEVTLIIDNQSGGLATDFTEVAVTRRLDRSGESEYRLNGVACRLKDVHDLLLDTGMGSHGYAVIQAAMIDAILSENADERRFLFEEAAGVSKYKVRQKAALRKMEATEQDLLRLTDLKNEVATRTRSLARQKGMAERHRQLREKWQQVDLALSWREYRRRLERATALQAEHQQAREASLTLTAQVDALDLEWQGLRLALDDAERLAQAAADRLTEANNALHDHRTAIVRAQDRRRHLDEDQTRLVERQASLVARQAELEQRRLQADYEAGNAKAAREIIAGRIAQTEENYRTTRDAVAAQNERLRTIEAEHTQAQHAYLRVVSHREALAQRADDVLRQRDALRERRERQAATLAETEAQATRLTQELEQSRSEHDSVTRVLAEAQRAVAEWENEKTRLSEELRQRTERLRELSEARELVASLIASGEGLGEGAARILGDAQWSGRFCGWVDRLSVDPEWQRAVEAALADRLGVLAANDGNAVSELIAFLGSETRGRVAILDAGMTPGKAPRPTTSDPSFRGWLSDKIGSDAADRAWVDALFGAVAVADDATAARRLFEALGGQVAVVTREGLLYAPPGILYAGTESAEPLVGRADRLREHDERLAEADRALLEGQKRLDDLAQRLVTERPRIEENRAQEQRLLSSISTLQLDLQSASTRLTEYRRRAEELDAEWAEQQSLDLAASAVDGSSEDTLKTDAERLATDLAAAQAESAQAEEAQTRAATELNQARVEAVEAQAKLDAHLAERRRCEETAAEVRVEQESLASRLTEIHVELEDLAVTLATAAEREGQLQGDCDAAEQRRAATRNEVVRQKDTMSAVDGRLREARHARDAAEQKRSQLEIDLSGLRHDAEQWRARMQETHRIDPSTATVEDVPDTDEELAARAESLKQQIEKLGPVNPLALEEYQHEKERWDFLEKQVGDLRQAKQQLQETIDELNRTAGERFMETFNAARTNFQGVFTELFRGGEADVILTQPETPLESPIEIYARPRGKKFIGIRQLSGGERALTALALLFGLYLVKPSPFCIFDEVDAPLDDANCGRFLRLIDRFKGRTQFIIVTHNKLTMEAADALYGVTMEQPGVSRLVSVRLNRAGESAEPGLAEPRIVIADAIPASEPATADADPS
jgi:chromosome segregation protein